MLNESLKLADPPDEIYRRTGKHPYNWLLQKSKIVVVYDKKKQRNQGKIVFSIVIIAYMCT